MNELKYKVGDRVKYDSEICTVTKVLESQGKFKYRVQSDTWFDVVEDEMIEGLVEEETKPKYEDEVNGEYYSTPKYMVRPNGYQFVDENGNIINAMKIVLEKKKKKFPKSYEECCEVLGCIAGYVWGGYKGDLIKTFHMLYICRDAYWKIYGEDMGLDKPWEPTDSDYTTGRYCIFVHRGNIICDTPAQDCILTFPTAEMRDAFYKHFKEEIEKCKELL